MTRWLQHGDKHMWMQLVHIIRDIAQGPQEDLATSAVELMTSCLKEVIKPCLQHRNANVRMEDVRIMIYLARGSREDLALHRR
mmetsp:Transcript_161297/g.517809  ORF Transcript_161297/g.517809 Transcript_161297/m.517809 type:complete len:83 (-) Transcript_161297:693-941(-)